MTGDYEVKGTNYGEKPNCIAVSEPIRMTLETPSVNHNKASFNGHLVTIKPPGGWNAKFGLYSTLFLCVKNVGLLGAK